MPMGTQIFWSYSHEDDDLDGGRIIQLAKDVRTAYALQSAQNLEVFFDKEGIRWGDDWNQQIEEALFQSALFVPIVTPRYFLREQCRRELRRFLDKATSLGVQELVLPILYVDVPQLKEATKDTDELISRVAMTQWEDFTKLRFEDRDKSSYRIAVNSLATKIIERQTSVTVVTANFTDEVTSTNEDEVDEDGEPGLVELAVSASENIDRINSLLESTQGPIVEIGHVLDAYSSRISKPSLSPRLLLVELNNFGRALKEPAERFESVCKEVAESTLALTPFVQQMIAFERGPSQEDDAPSTFSASLRELSLGNEVEQLNELIKTLDQFSSFSSSLRQPITKIRTGIRNLTDLDQTFSDWRKIAGVDPI